MQRITREDLAAAFDSLDEAEKAAVTNSATVKLSRSGFTKFASAIIVGMLHKISTSPLTVRAAFRGNLSGQSGGANGGLVAIRDFMRSRVEAAQCRFDEKEVLLDFVVSDDDVLRVRMTAESEARPIASADDVHDFDKLLLVKSPVRVFVSRVNVTKRNQTAKRDAAEAALRDRLKLAQVSNIFSSDDEIVVVLIVTSASGDRAARVALARGGASLVFSDLSFLCRCMMGVCPC